MTEPTDWQLVAAAREGDLAAFERLVRRYQQPVVGFCYRMTRSYEDAEDLAQETFLRVHRHLGRLQEQAKFSTVLFGIARNLTLNHLRDAARRGRGKTDSLTSEARLERPLPDGAPGPDGEARLREMERFVEQGIARLSDEHREIVVLRDIRGLDYDSIAEILGCKKGTVKSRLARARGQLREHIEALGGALE